MVSASSKGGVSVDFWSLEEKWARDQSHRTLLLYIGEGSNRTPRQGQGTRTPSLDEILKNVWLPHFACPLFPSETQTVAPTSAAVPQSVATKSPMS